MLNSSTTVPTTAAAQIGPAGRSEQVSLTILIGVQHNIHVCMIIEGGSCSFLSIAARNLLQASIN
jgi:hypothetical protein